MLSTYTYPSYAYRRPVELDASHRLHRHPVVVVGAGPVGLAAAIDLAQRGQQVVLLDDDTPSAPAHAACATPSARWKSWTAWVAVMRWSPRA